MDVATEKIEDPEKNVKRGDCASPAHLLLRSTKEEKTMKRLIEELMTVNPDALHVVRNVLEARVGSAMIKTDNIELRSDVRRAYAILSKIVEQVKNDISDEEITTVKALNLPTDAF